MAKKTTNIERAQLRQRVEWFLDHEMQAEQPTDYAQALIGLLAEISEALSALDLGVTPEIFIPTSKLHRGSDPEEIRKIRLRAVFYVEALRRRGKSLSEALAEVGDKFGLDGESIKKWRAPIVRRGAKDTPVPDDLIAVRTMLSADRLWHRDRPEKDILDSALRDGQRYRELRPFCKGK